MPAQAVGGDAADEAARRASRAGADGSGHGRQPGLLFYSPKWGRAFSSPNVPAQRVPDHLRRTSMPASAWSRSTFTVARSDGSVVEASLGQRDLRAEADDVSVGVWLAALAQAHDFKESSRPLRRPAWRGRSRTRRPSDGRRTAHAIARTTLALAHIDRGALGAACRAWRRRARTIGAIHSSRSWVGAVAYAASWPPSCCRRASSPRRSGKPPRRLRRRALDRSPCVAVAAPGARVRCQRGHLSEASQALDLAPASSST